jgi:dephospho-CoA kinase
MHRKENEKSHILIIGPMGTGKSSFASLLKQEGWHVISAGDTIRKMAKASGYTEKREDLQLFGSALLLHKGYTYFTEMLVDQMNGSKKILFEGIRPFKVITELMKIVPDLFIIYIESDSETRFFRLHQKDGLTRDEFNLLENHPMEKQVEFTRELANYVLNNSGDVSHAFEVLKNAIK